jgi:hypothetical protein
MRDLFEAVEPYDEDPYVDVRSILYIYMCVCVWIVDTCVCTCACDLYNKEQEENDGMSSSKESNMESKRVTQR